VGYSQQPVYRKVIIPWYDSNLIGIATIIFMAAVMLFGFYGIIVAREYLKYHEYIWVPILLSGLSFGVAASIFIRILRRLIYKIYKDLRQL
jgi:riboflavin transporter FmnP